MESLFYTIGRYLVYKGLMTMRLSVLLLAAFILPANASASAQTVSISVSKMPLEMVCKEVEKQTGYFFVYANELNKDQHLISVTIQNASIEDALKLIFKGLPFSWKIIDKVIVLNAVIKTTPTIQEDSSKGPGKRIKPRGVVLTSNGQPLSGASVTIRSNGKSTLTNSKGEFIFYQDVPLNSIITISYVGYLTRQVALREDGVLRVYLDMAMNELDAPVIKGYYNTTNRLNTGNVSTIKGEDINKQPVTDPLLALSGRVAGLYISQSSGVPGAYSTVRLRGMNSIPDISRKRGTANDPLYIVDGVPFGSASLTNPYVNSILSSSSSVEPLPGEGISPFNSLNPADIESIEILKDADATAIYGSRGANGVILISTKRGKAGNTRVDLNAYGGVGSVTHKMKFLNTKQYLQMRNEAIQNDGLSISESDFDINGIWDPNSYTDWQKLLIGNPAKFTNVQARLSGGNASTQFTIGTTYSNQETVFPGRYSDQKGSVHFNINNISANGRFKAQLSASYVNDNSNLPGFNLTRTIILAPNAPRPFDKNGNLNWQLYKNAQTWDNPFAQTRNNANAVTDNLISNLVLNYQVIDGLDFKISAGYNHQEMNQSSITRASSYPPPNDTRPSSRQNAFANANVKSWIIEPQISFRKIEGKIKLDFLIGATFQQNKVTSLSQLASGFINDALIPNVQAATSVYVRANTYELYKYNAAFGRLNIDWNEKYLFNLTARRDGSSRFGPGKQFGNFGAIGVGWIFTKEEFMNKLIGAMDFGKIRASYGVTGSDQIRDYQYLSTYTSNGVAYEQVSGLSPNNLANPLFGWEQVKKKEIAMELGFFNSQVLFSLSYYHNRTGNQLVGYILPTITGFGSVQANLPATIDNMGTEYTLNTTIIKNKNFKWSSIFNISFPRNKLVSYPGIENSSYNYIYAVGQSLFTTYTYSSKGVNPQTGLYQFFTKSGSDIPDFVTDQVLTKALTQNYYGGLQNTFIYKGFQLDLLFQFVKQMGYSGTKSFDNQPGIFNSNQSISVLKRWKKYGDVTNVQKFSTVGYTNSIYSTFANNSNGLITDISFIRLKNVAFSYQFSNKIIKKCHFQNARLYIQCQNLVTISQYVGLDPETGGLNLPPIKMITAGFQVTL